VAHDEWRQQLRIAVARHNAAEIAGLLEDQLPDEGLQHAGDAVLCALATDPDAAVVVTTRVVDTLRARFWDGDEELADAIDAALGRRPGTRAPLDIDLELFADALTEPPGSVRLPRPPHRHRHHRGDARLR
jgi:hypothetical protein